MEQLERLSLVSRIATELHNHWGISDKDLAEFVLHLGEESESLEEFRAKLKSNGSAVTHALAVSLYTSISKFVARSKNPKSAAATAAGAAAAAGGSSSTPSPGAVKDSKDPPSSSSSSGSSSGTKPLPPNAFSLSHHPPTEKELKFPGLCMQNRFDRPELQLARPDEHAPLSLHAQRLLEREKDEKELMKEQQEAFNRAKNGGYWGDRDGNKHSSSSSSNSNRGSLSATGANAVPVGGGAGAAAAAAAAADESLNFCGRKGAPLHRYGIYDGVVSRVMEYGAFVQLELQEGRREGLLHVADMSRPDGGPCVNA
ncbi:hypothetical protein EBH_0007450 [Eimeria brunetti]|uniref:Uncharacterized protein n=1 Tax=Eimeria brunetti TaxID=51314 RepID=U6LXZ0_9EIME|nr:hypothetical protein EBH_0007450 [Eimeria brunetti]